MEEKRSKNPIHTFDGVDDQGSSQLVKCEIPFNSTNKYNLIIRDCNDPED